VPGPVAPPTGPGRIEAASASAQLTLDRRSEAVCRLEPVINHADHRFGTHALRPTALAAPSLTGAAVDASPCRAEPCRVTARHGGSSLPV
jgi:hypothetical protein